MREHISRVKVRPREKKMSEKGLSDANQNIEDLVVLGLWFWKPIGLKSTLIQVIARETHIIAIRSRGSRELRQT